MTRAPARSGDRNGGFPTTAEKPPLQPSGVTVVPDPAGQWYRGGGAAYYHELIVDPHRPDTIYSINALPIGGFVRVKGEDGRSFDEDSMQAKTPRQRAGFLAAGSAMNFLLAIVIFTCLFTFMGKPSTSARVDKVEANSAAAAAGFQAGDIVTAIDGKAIGSFSDMQRVVGIHPGNQLTFTVKRGESSVTLKGTPELREVKDPFGNTHKLGVMGITRATAPGDVVTERVDPATAAWLGVKETWFVVDRTLAYIGGVFTGREAADQVGGPLRIAQISGQVATIGLAALVHLAAVLSISIGLLNLFPVPLLDGGHLLFYLVEAVRGRPLSERAQEMGFRIGLGLVLMLMVFATYNDILHLAAS